MLPSSRRNDHGGQWFSSATRIKKEPVRSRWVRANPEGKRLRDDLMRTDRVLNLLLDTDDGRGNRHQ